MALDFYNTVGGRKFIDGTVPELIRVIDKLAKALEKHNELLERQNQKAPEQKPSPKG